ncbi:MAG: FliH/SctL family protein [Rhodanobacter sp.]|jgi:flagellar assembly protein FliH
MAAVFDNEATEFQRWELPQVGSAPVPEKVVAPAQPTVRELEALEQQARDEGFAAGHAEGMAAAKAQGEQQMERLLAVYKAAARPLDVLDERTAQELVRLATVIARRVVLAELKQSPELIAQSVREGVKALPSASRDLRVILHPDDMALLRELGVVEEHWQLSADPSLARGDSMMESGRSRLDLRLDTRLAAVIDAVLGDDILAEEEGA